MTMLSWGVWGMVAAMSVVGLCAGAYLICMAYKLGHEIHCRRHCKEKH